MDRKLKFLVSSSLVAVMATGCSSFGSRGNTDPQTNVTGVTNGGYAGQQRASSSAVNNTAYNSCAQCAVNNAQQQTAANTGGRTQQWYVDQWNRQQAASQKPAPATTNGRTQQWYIDQYNRSQAAAKVKTTTTNGRSQQWYIDQYNRSQAAAKAKAAAPAPVKPATNGRSKQWYVDQWNRQQAAAKRPTPRPVVRPAYVPPKPVVVQQPVYVAPKPTYVAPAYVPPKPVVPVKRYVAPAPATKTATQYIDYTNGAASAPATIVAPSNKSLYTGSFQQPVQAYTQYTPKTFTGGAGSSNTTYTAPVSSGNGSTYTVKKGDTVFEVMRQTGVYWKEIISMNNLQAPSYTIQPGQQLRLK